MKRLVRDAVLIGATAAAVWFVRGDAQQTEPVAYNVPVVILCNQGIVTSANISEGAFSLYNLRWSADYPLQQSLRGGSSFFDCTITPYLAEDVGP